MTDDYAARHYASALAALHARIRAALLRADDTTAADLATEFAMTTARARRRGVLDEAMRLAGLRSQSTVGVGRGVVND